MQRSLQFLQLTLAVETTDETNEAEQDATIGQGGGEASGEADSLAYLDNAPIKSR